MPVPAPEQATYFLPVPDEMHLIVPTSGSVLKVRFSLGGEAGSGLVESV